MGVLFNSIIALLISALVIWIVSKLNLGFTVKGYGGAIIAAIVIAVVTAIVFWLLGLLSITIGGGLLGWIIRSIVAAVVLLLQRQVPARYGSQRLQRGDHRGYRHRCSELDHQLPGWLGPFGITI